MAWRTVSAVSTPVVSNVTVVPCGQGAVSSGRTSASASPRKCSGARSTRQPETGLPSRARGREATAQPRRARLSIPIPAASSAATSASRQPFSPNERRTAGSVMPVPSSVTVTAKGPPSGPATTTRTRAASARRAFCRSSVKMSPSVAAKVRVTRFKALSWMRARILRVSFMCAFSVMDAECGNAQRPAPDDAGRGAEPGGGTLSGRGAGTRGCRAPRRRPRRR